MVDWRVWSGEEVGRGGVWVAGGRCSLVRRVGGVPIPPVDGRGAARRSPNDPPIAWLVRPLTWRPRNCDLARSQGRPRPPKPGRWGLEGGTTGLVVGAAMWCR